MLPHALFWVGLVTGVYIYWWAAVHVEKMKTGPLLFPFFMILAAAVAKYIGF